MIQKFTMKRSTLKSFAYRKRAEQALTTDFTKAAMTASDGRGAHHDRGQYGDCIIADTVRVRITESTESKFNVLANTVQDTENHPSLLLCTVAEPVTAGLHIIYKIGTFQQVDRNW